MDQISRLLVEKGLLLKKFQTINIKNITKSRSYSVYFGVDMKSNCTVVFVRNAKSRFVQKDATALLSLCDDILQKEAKIVRQRVFFYNSQICSKSLKILKDKHWRVYAFV